MPFYPAAIPRALAYGGCRLRCLCRETYSDQVLRTLAHRQELHEMPFTSIRDAEAAGSNPAFPTHSLTH